MSGSRLSLAFACDWKKNRRDTWSHTPLSLSEALARRGDVSLGDIDAAPGALPLLAMQIAGGRIIDGKIKSRFRFMPQYLRMLERNTLRALETAGPFDAVLQIGDLARTGALPSFLYQDLSIDLAIRFLRENGRRLPAFEQFSLADLERRRERQLRIYEAAAGVFTMSAWLANSLAADTGLPRERLHVVHAGTNVRSGGAEALAAPDPRERRVLFIGRDFARKGGALVVEAFALLRKMAPGSVTLVVAGPRRWPLRGPVPDGVVFLGDAPWPVLRDEFLRAGVFCMPSYAEGLGIVFVEALGFGVPCIGRKVAAIPEMVRDGVNGYCIDHADPAQLAELLLRVLADEEMQERVRADAARVRSYFSWERVADDMVRIIRQTIA